MNNISRPIKSLPTHGELTEFVFALLPLHPRDVAPIYHEPRFPGYSPAKTYVHDVVLSITPTPGVYSRLTDLSLLGRPSRLTCFLHRPFNLDRKAVPRGSLVLASHKRFDELLTVGWNVALAARLGLDVETSMCLQGYKGDPDRRIGLVARLRASQSLRHVHQSVLGEFGIGDIVPAQTEDSPDTIVGAIAIMNAFGADEVDRAVEAATKAGFIPEGDHAKLVYLTGEPKELGLAATRDKYAGMVAVCVGHRAAEEWGIKCLATSIKQRWADINIHTVFEEEVVPEVIKKKKPIQTERHGESNGLSSVPDGAFVDTS